MSYGSGDKSWKARVEALKLLGVEMMVQSAGVSLIDGQSTQDWLMPSR
jgi:hypothetical protein